MSIPAAKERSLHVVQGNGLSLVYWYATRQKSLVDIFTNLIIWVGWHAFMGKILGSQTVDGYVLMAGEKV